MSSDHVLMFSSGRLDGESLQMPKFCDDEEGLELGSGRLQWLEERVHMLDSKLATFESTFAQQKSVFDNGLSQTLS